jgi:dienelactone hydrolase
MFKTLMSGLDMLLPQGGWCRLDWHQKELSMSESFPIVFSHGGVSLEGRFYRNTSSLTVRQPAVIVTGSWLTVQDQMPAHYAQRLAAHGFTAFTFDFSGFGRSGGSPRQLEMPSRKIAEISAAADFVSTMSFVSNGGVGHLAICASAQYALAAIARGACIQSFVSVAGWFHDSTSIAGFYGGAEGVAARVARSARATDRFLATGEVELVPAYQAGNEDAAMSFPDDYYANPKRGAIPAWTNQLATMSWLHWLGFDGLSAASAANDRRVPSLFVHSDGCAFPSVVRSICKQVHGKLLWLEGNQLDFYDQPLRVDRAVEAAHAHFAATLEGPKSVPLAVTSA